MKFRPLRQREKEKEKDKEKENLKDKEKELNWNSIQTKDKNQIERSKTPVRLLQRSKTERPRKIIDSSQKLVVNLRNYRIFCQRKTFNFNY